MVLVGFLAVPVFRIEDTEGEPLSYESPRVPPFPLLEVAESWGISVKAVPKEGRYYGWYWQTEDEISLASEEEVVFFHELSHAAHKRLLGQLKAGSDWKQEIVAELCAAVLCQLVGRSPGKFLGNHYQYISHYAEEAGLAPVQGCLQVIKDVEGVLELILSQSQNLSQASS